MKTDEIITKLITDGEKTAAEAVAHLGLVNRAKMQDAIELLTLAKLLQEVSDG